ncbi:p53-like transcription factor [Parathielavia appendiculata]|uniref:P53-like transcription factor n=1 Tax=Parathielavia appendiculata TaxID=2587402 RepID=A0AAN6Z7E3_9PEZI|nr:p53-like transcription factor [Parathielavia appendiculata]
MAELRAETQHGSLWSNYGNPVPMTNRYPHDPSVSVPPPPTSSHLVRPRSHHTMDYPPYQPGRPGQEEGEPYDRYPHPSMNIPSINSLKRPYSQVDQAPYTEMVQDLRDDYKPPNHDQKLLSFKKVGDKHTIVDTKGRIHEMEIDAQLHGMFFLSEFPSATGDGNGLNAELTCYRRNLFQISGSLCFPQIPLSVLLESGETSQIKNMEVSISAIESVDGHPVRLIVIPWKTPPPNSPEANQAPDQEPPTLPLIPPSEEEDETGGDHYAIYPIGWRRLQFRIATANNGRRKELQQHFVLHLKLHGTLANGQKLVLSELTTAPIVVRGRSPRNFQARKEIPLLGSSAGSRGQTLVETGHGIVAQAVILNKPPYDSRPRLSSLDVPRSAFTFTAPKQMPQSPMQMRSNSYPTTWNPTPQVSMPHTTGAATYPTSTMPPDPYPKMPLSGAPTFTAEPQDMPLQPTSMGSSVPLPLASPHDPHQHHHAQQPQPPIRTQYATYTSAPPHHLSLSTTTGAAGGPSPDTSNLAVPRYIGDAGNPRPSKSPRHASHQSVASSISNDTASGEYRYGPPPSQPQQQHQQAPHGGPYSAGASEVSPQSQHPSLPPLQDQAANGAASQPGIGVGSGGGGGGQASSGRDYYTTTGPAPGGWGPAPGDHGAAGAPGQGGDRPYGYPAGAAAGAAAGGASVKTEPHAAAGGSAPGTGYGYAWNTA